MFVAPFDAMRFTLLFVNCCVYVCVCVPQGEHVKAKKAAQKEMNALNALKVRFAATFAWDQCA